MPKTLPIPNLYLYKHDPLGFAADLLGFQPDEQQARVLDARIRKGMLCCTRGFGKTEITAILAAWHMTMEPGSTTLVVSESANKAAELAERVRKWLLALGLELETDPLRKNGFRTPNGSRLLPIPCRANAVRGYRATMVLVDEAAVVPDKVWTAVTGTMATGADRCRIWMMSTPGARTGFFHDTWMNGDPTWTRVRVAARDCPRVNRTFLAEMERDLDPEDFQREYGAEFGGGGESVFDEDGFRRALREDVPALDMETRFAPTRWNLGGDRVLTADGRMVPRNGFYIGIDMGQERDYTTLAILEYFIETLGTMDAMTRVPHCRAAFRLRWLMRVPLATSYVEIAELVEDMLTHNGELRQKAALVVDATGVGRGFADLLRSKRLGVPVHAVQITGGTAIRQEKGMTNIPKTELVATLGRALRNGSLTIAAQVPLLREFRREMMAYARRRMPSGRYGYGAPAGQHDDLVMAVALGLGFAWWVHRPRGFELAA